MLTFFEFDVPDLVSPNVRFQSGNLENLVKKQLFFWKYVWIVSTRNRERYPVRCVFLIKKWDLNTKHIFWTKFEQFHDYLPTFSVLWPLHEQIYWKSLRTEFSGSLENCFFEQFTDHYFVKYSSFFVTIILSLYELYSPCCMNYAPLFLNNFGITLL